MISVPHDATGLHLVLDEIRRERVRQDEKFGDQTCRDGKDWSLILAEEVGEAAREACDAYVHGKVWCADPQATLRTREALRKELIQSAAVCVAFVQYGDASGWW
jgi:hypothetical protein